MTVLDEVDVARYAGLMAEPPTLVPAWFSDQLRDDLLETFVRFRTLNPAPPLILNLSMLSHPAGTCVLSHTLRPSMTSPGHLLLNMLPNALTIAPACIIILFAHKGFAE